MSCNYVFKTSSRHLQDVLVRRLAIMSSRCLQDVFKTSSVRLHQDKCLLGPSKHSSSEDVFINTNMFTLASCHQRTSSRRLQDVLVKINIFVLAIHLQDVFKTFYRRLQDIFKTSSRHLQDIFKTFSRCIIKLNCCC